jgi:hypothetical protein
MVTGGGAQAAAGGAPGGPPPIPGSATFFVAVGGQRSGPFDLPALVQQANVGRVTRETLVWTAGMSQWTPAGQVAALAEVLASVPPPIPPKG